MTNGKWKTCFSILFLFACVCVGGCGREVEVFPQPGGAGESGRILRNANTGPIVATFTSYPLKADAPPDGVRMAVQRSLGRFPCSYATFFWSDRAMAERWLREQIDIRRQYGYPARLILAGHGIGATEASEVAKDVLLWNTGAEIVLLLTVDAVKTGRVSTAAGITGAATVGRIPGVNMNFTAYDAAPLPDRVHLWTHVNYYQKNGSYHGSPMPWAENHLLEDWTGMLNHGNADDFALPLMATDIRAALERALR